MPRDFSPFLTNYPPEKPSEVDVSFLKKQIKREFGISLPQPLAEFLTEVGSGYFGNRQLYFFGDGKTPAPRDSLVAWNKMDWWEEIFEKPRKGGPFFFAET